MNLANLELIAKNIVNTEEQVSKIDLTPLKKYIVEKHNEALDIFNTIDDFLKKTLPLLTKRAEGEWTLRGRYKDEGYKNPYNSIIKYWEDNRDDDGNTYLRIDYWVNGKEGLGVHFQYKNGELVKMYPYYNRWADDGRDWTYTAYLYHWLNQYNISNLATLGSIDTKWTEVSGVTEHNATILKNAVDSYLLAANDLLKRVGVVMEKLSAESRQRMDRLTELTNSAERSEGRKTTIKFEIYS